MESFITYFVKVNAVLSILYLVYWLLLRNEKFFKLNRFFLLSTLIIAIALPLVPANVSPRIRALQQQVTSLNPLASLYDSNSKIMNMADDSTQNTGEVSAPGFGFDLTAKELFLMLYLLISIILLVRFLMRLVFLYFFIIKSRRTRIGGLQCCEHDGKISPFSFFFYLVINSSRYSDEQFRQIRAHEAVHIRQGHTFDLLIAEVVHIFLWVNPLMPSLKRFLKLNLEYIADHKVLNSGFDKRKYQLNILYSCVNPTTFPLTNLFSSSRLKLRIKMMNAQKSPASHLYKYAIMVAIVFSTYFGIQILGVRSLQAHGNDNAGVSADGKDFEGYYVYQKNRKLVLQITSTEQGLILKELWTGDEIPFIPLSELQYYNRHRDFPLQFAKATDGRITSVVAFNEDVWDKLNPFLQEFKLTAKELKAFEGYYQFEENPDMYLQFSVKENGLIAKEVWSGKEYFIQPKSALEFHSAPEQYPAKFSKDKNGVVTQVLVFNEDTWKKVKEYTPRKELTLSPEKLKSFEGRYTFEFQPGQPAFLQITAKDDHLLVKEMWTGNEMKFKASSELEFFNKERAFPLKFTKNSTGTVTHVLAFNRDLWTKVKE